MALSVGQMLPQALRAAAPSAPLPATGSRWHGRQWLRLCPVISNPSRGYRRGSGSLPLPGQEVMRAGIRAEAGATVVVARLPR